MIQVLTDNEARIIGCLMEKSVTTPDQYPLTLNALTNASNQKSARNPILSLQPGLVQRTVQDLQDKHLVRADENFKSRSEKFVQRFCNTRFSEHQFDSAQYAIICLLLLRGPQTPGELRAHSGRLHSFENNAAVMDSLTELTNEENALVVQLARTPGRKDSEFMHLFCGPIDTDVQTRIIQDRHSPGNLPTEKPNTAELEQRILKLEAEVADLRKQFEK